VIGGRRSLKGRKLADRRVRVERPHSPYFRYSAEGHLTAKEAAGAPTSTLGRVSAQIRRILVGRPLSSEQEIGERLSKAKALAIFSSDAISSSAYATEEIVRVLILGGIAALTLSVEISLAIAILLGTVALSYRQVVRAYPAGGGSYSVSKANFGARVSLIAASALLIDYVMTVAVSTSSAVEQIVSAIPELYDVRILIGVGAIGLITLGNLRGIREAGNIFAVPTYLFVGSALLMIAVGGFRVVVLGESQPYPGEVPDVLEPVTILLLLRAFAAGAVALTGTEAIATGVPAFKPPESRNAATTLAVMAVLLGVLFVGITFLATNFGVVYVDEPTKKTVISQVASAVYGADSIGFYLFQTFTAVLLFLAANTSFNAFPRLAAILAQDSYMPRQFAFRGDRLAYSWGILVLGGVAATLVAVFGGDTHLLIPLYAVGVFIDFTISQAGMIRHWLATRDPGWRRSLAINAFGCALTAVVAVVVTVAKAPASLLVLVLIPIQVAIMLFIHRQYQAQAAELRVEEDVVFAGPARARRVVVPVNGLNRAVVQAVNFGRTIADDVRAVFVTEEADEATGLRARWEHQMPGVALVVVESPYRSLVGPVLAYLDVLDASWPPDKEAPVTVVVIPEYVAKRWWDRLLYNQAARRLRRELIGRDNTVVADVPYRREH
jgi:amino acid transporter